MAYFVSNRQLGMWKGDFYPDDWIKIRCDE